VFDFLIVGAGFAGAVVAERMAKVFGKKVLIIDRRNHIGGNAYDYWNADGLLVHQYGPHIFHTNSDQVFNYLSAFTAWRAYEHRVLASVDGKLVPVPINLDTVNILYGKQLNSLQLDAFLKSVAEPKETIRTSEDVVVSKVGRYLYSKLFQGYTRKQWGIDASKLDAQVTARIPVRTDQDDRYFSDTFQAMPKFGYTHLFENMLDHPSITVEVGVDYRDVMKSVSFRELVYTGPIDEYFGYCFGKLPYRSLRFQHETVDTERFQCVGVVNYPNDHAYTRITEFKHLTGQVHPKTSIVYEFPCNDGDPYYPIPRAENAHIYSKYAELAKTSPGVHFVGRLATYRYYNMDQVVAQALTLCSHLSGVSRTTLCEDTAQAAAAFAA